MKIIKIGSKGSLVTTIQTYLNKNGFICAIDGFYGSQTAHQVSFYQSANKLSIDGIVGKNTLNLIIKGIITDVCTQCGIEPLLGIAVASCEGGLDPLATLYNKPSKSTDRGIYQINDKYHSDVSDLQAFDPYFSTQWFCNAVKNGKLNTYWSASRNCWSLILTPDIKSKYGII